MDKEFWVSLARNDFQVQEGYILSNLTDILFSFLGSPDPELRDDIAYIVYVNWLKQEMYSSEELKSHVDKLLLNLEKGIGETESDTVFLRAFSVLLLAEIVHNDNKKPVLEKDQVSRILEKGLWYLDANSILEIVRRELIPSDQVERWTKSFIMPDGKDWKDAYEDERRNKAYQNIRNLLRSIYLALTAQPGEFPNREQLMGLVFESISAIHR